jgi:Fe-S oxidoreductase
VVHLLNKPMPPGMPSRTSRALLDIEDGTLIPVIRDPKRTAEYSDAVFYFPGCGSERLFSQVGLATQAMLWHVGATTVLPPGYLCCGYPQTSSGNEDVGQAITMQNRVLFHRVANTLNYLDIKTVLVSCGTCLDQLEKYQFDKIFPGCRLLDIHEYLLEKGMKLDGLQGTQYLYHDPCHTPMKVHSGVRVASALMGKNVPLSDRCCGEAGTLAVTRPDVSTQVRFRKQQEIEAGFAALKVSRGETPKILTSCPSCLQGLWRYTDDAKDGALDADYIVVEMANRLLGKDWQRQYIAAANAGGMERVLL